MAYPSIIKILVIDDEAPIRSSLRDFLEDFDYVVEEAETAEEALELAARQEFQVSIVDLRLPGMSGDLFILKAHTLWPALKFIIHTGSVGYHLGPELAEIGMTDTDVFRKPVANLLSFVEKIKEIMNR